MFNSIKQFKRSIKCEKTVFKRVLYNVVIILSWKSNFKIAARSNKKIWVWHYYFTTVTVNLLTVIMVIIIIILISDKLATGD